MSRALWEPAGSCSSYFKRLKLPSASHYMVTEEGWKTPESKQVICGLNHPLDTCFSPLQIWGGCTSKWGASAEHLGWQIQAVVLEGLILKAALWPEAHIVLYLSIVWPQCMFGCEHGLRSYTNGVYLTQHRKRHGLDVIGPLQLQKLYLPVHIKWIYICWVKEMSAEPEKKASPAWLMPQLSNYDPQAVNKLYMLAVLISSYKQLKQIKYYPTLFLLIIQGMLSTQEQECRWSA